MPDNIFKIIGRGYFEDDRKLEGGGSSVEDADKVAENKQKAEALLRQNVAISWDAPAVATEAHNRALEVERLVTAVNLLSAESVTGAVPVREAGIQAGMDAHTALLANDVQHFSAVTINRICTEVLRAVAIVGGDSQLTVALGAVARNVDIPESIRGAIDKRNQGTAFADVAELETFIRAAFNAYIAMNAAIVHAAQNGATTETLIAMRNVAEAVLNPSDLAGHPVPDVANLVNGVVVAMRVFVPANAAQVTARDNACNHIQLDTGLALDNTHQAITDARASANTTVAFNVINALDPANAVRVNMEGRRAEIIGTANKEALSEIIANPVMLAKAAAIAAAAVGAARQMRAMQSSLSLHWMPTFTDAILREVQEIAIQVALDNDGDLNEIANAVNNHMTNRVINSKPNDFNERVLEAITATKDLLLASASLASLDQVQAAIGVPAINPPGDRNSTIIHHAVTASRTIADSFYNSRNEIDHLATEVNAVDDASATSAINTQTHANFTIALGYLPVEIQPFFTSPHVIAKADRLAAQKLSDAARDALYDTNATRAAIARVVTTAGVPDGVRNASLAVIGNDIVAVTTATETAARVYGVEQIRLAIAGESQVSAGVDGPLKVAFNARVVASDTIDQVADALRVVATDPLYNVATRQAELTNVTNNLVLLKHSIVDLEGITDVADRNTRIGELDALSSANLAEAFIRALQSAPSANVTKDDIQILAELLQINIGVIYSTTPPDPRFTAVDSDLTISDNRKITRLGNQINKPTLFLEVTANEIKIVDENPLKDVKLANADPAENNKAQFLVLEKLANHSRPPVAIAVFDGLNRDLSLLAGFVDVIPGLAVEIERQKTEEGAGNPYTPSAQLLNNAKSYLHIHTKIHDAVNEQAPNLRAPKFKTLDKALTQKTFAEAFNLFATTEAEKQALYDRIKTAVAPAFAGDDAAKVAILNNPANIKPGAWNDLRKMTLAKLLQSDPNYMVSFLNKATLAEIQVLEVALADPTNQAKQDAKNVVLYHLMKPRSIGMEDVDNTGAFTTPPAYTQLCQHISSVALQNGIRATKIAQKDFKFTQAISATEVPENSLFAAVVRNLEQTPEALDTLKGELLERIEAGIPEPFLTYVKQAIIAHKQDATITTEVNATAPSITNVRLRELYAQSLNIDNSAGVNLGKPLAGERPELNSHDIALLADTLVEQINDEALLRAALIAQDKRRILKVIEQRKQDVRAEAFRTGDWGTVDAQLNNINTDKDALIVQADTGNNFEADANAGAVADGNDITAMRLANLKTRYKAILARNQDFGGEDIAVLNSTATLNDQYAISVYKEGAPIIGANKVDLNVGPALTLANGEPPIHRGWVVNDELNRPEIRIYKAKDGKASALNSDVETLCNVHFGEVALAANNKVFLTETEYQALEALVYHLNAGGTLNVTVAQMQDLVRLAPAFSALTTVSFNAPWTFNSVNSGDKQFFNQIKTLYAQASLHKLKAIADLNAGDAVPLHLEALGYFSGRVDGLKTRIDDQKTVGGVAVVADDALINSAKRHYLLQSILFTPPNAGNSAELDVTRLLNVINAHDWNAVKAEFAGVTEVDAWKDAFLNAADADLVAQQAFRRAAFITLLKQGKPDHLHNLLEHINFSEKAHLISRLSDPTISKDYKKRAIATWLSVHFDLGNVTDIEDILNEKVLETFVRVASPINDQLKDIKAQKEAKNNLGLRTVDNADGRPLNVVNNIIEVLYLQKYGVQAVEQLTPNRVLAFDVARSDLVASLAAQLEGGTTLNLGVIDVSARLVVLGGSNGLVGEDLARAYIEKIATRSFDDIVDPTNALDLEILATACAPVPVAGAAKLHAKINLIRKGAPTAPTSHLHVRSESEDYDSENLAYLGDDTSVIHLVVQGEGVHRTFALASNPLKVARLSEAQRTSLKAVTILANGNNVVQADKENLIGALPFADIDPTVHQVMDDAFRDTARAEYLFDTFQFETNEERSQELLALVQEIEVYQTHAVEISRKRVATEALTPEEENAEKAVREALKELANHVRSEDLVVNAGYNWDNDQWIKTLRDSTQIADASGVAGAVITVSTSLVNAIKTTAFRKYCELNRSEIIDRLWVKANDEATLTELTNLLLLPKAARNDASHDTENGKLYDLLFEDKFGAGLTPDAKKELLADFITQNSLALQGLGRKIATVNARVALFPAGNAAGLDQRQINDHYNNYYQTILRLPQTVTEPAVDNALTTALKLDHRDLTSGMIQATQERIAKHLVNDEEYLKLIISRFDLSELIDLKNNPLQATNMSRFIRLLNQHVSGQNPVQVASAFDFNTLQASDFTKIAAINSLIIPIEQQKRIEAFNATNPSAQFESTTFAWYEVLSKTLAVLTVDQLRKIKTILDRNESETETFSQIIVDPDLKLAFAELKTIVGTEQKTIKATVEAIKSALDSHLSQQLIGALTKAELQALKTGLADTTRTRDSINLLIPRGGQIATEEERLLTNDHLLSATKRNLNDFKQFSAVMKQFTPETIAFDATTGNLITRTANPLAELVAYYETKQHDELPTSQQWKKLRSAIKENDKEAIRQALDELNNPPDWSTLRHGSTDGIATAIETRRSQIKRFDALYAQIANQPLAEAFKSINNIDSATGKQTGIRLTTLTQDVITEINTALREVNPLDGDLSNLIVALRKRGVVLKKDGLLSSTTQSDEYMKKLLRPYANEIKYAHQQQTEADKFVRSERKKFAQKNKEALTQSGQLLEEQALSEINELSKIFDLFKMRSIAFKGHENKIAEIWHDVRDLILLEQPQNATKKFNALMVESGICSRFDSPALNGADINLIMGISSPTEKEQVVVDIEHLNERVNEYKKSSLAERKLMDFSWYAKEISNLDSWLEGVEKEIRNLSGTAEELDYARTCEVIVSKAINDYASRIPGPEILEYLLSLETEAKKLEVALAKFDTGYRNSDLQNQLKAIRKTIKNESNALNLPSDSKKRDQLIQTYKDKVKQLEKTKTKLDLVCYETEKDAFGHVKFETEKDAAGNVIKKSDKPVFKKHGDKFIQRKPSDALQATFGGVVSRKFKVAELVSVRKRAGLGSPGGSEATLGATLGDTKMLREKAVADTVDYQEYSKSAITTINPLSGDKERDPSSTRVAEVLTSTAGSYGEWTGATSYVQGAEDETVPCPTIGGIDNLRYMDDPRILIDREKEPYFYVIGTDSARHEVKLGKPRPTPFTGGDFELCKNTLENSMITITSPTRLPVNIVTFFNQISNSVDAIVQLKNTQKLDSPQLGRYIDDIKEAKWKIENHYRTTATPLPASVSDELTKLDSMLDAAKNFEQAKTDRELVAKQCFSIIMKQVYEANLQGKKQISLIAVDHLHLRFLLAAVEFVKRLCPNESAGISFNCDKAIHPRTGQSTEALYKTLKDDEHVSLKDVGKSDYFFNSAPPYFDFNTTETSASMVKELVKHLGFRPDKPDDSIFKDYMKTERESMQTINGISKKKTLTTKNLFKGVKNMQNTDLKKNEEDLAVMATYKRKP